MPDNAGAMSTSAFHCGDELAQAAARYLYDGLTNAERHAMCLVSRYVDGCDLRCRSGDSQHKVADILSWTSLYHRRDKLAAACVQQTVSPSDTSESLDWLRVLCCVLDQKRLQRAQDAVKNQSVEPSDGQHDAQKKPSNPLESVASVNVCVQTDPYHDNFRFKKRRRGCVDETEVDVAAQSGLSPSREGNKEKVLDCHHTLNETACVSNSSTFADSGPNTSESNLSNDDGNKENVPDNENIPDRENVLASPSCKSLVLQPSEAPFDDVVHFPVNGYRRYSSVTFANERRLLRFFIKKWVNEVATCLFQQLGLPENSESAENAATDTFMSPKMLSCGRLVAVCERIFQHMSWILDGSSLGSSFEGSTSAAVSNSYTLQNYAEQMKAVEKTVADLFCFSSPLCSSQKENALVTQNVLSATSASLAEHVEDSSVLSEQKLDAMSVFRWTLRADTVALCTTDTTDFCSAERSVSQPNDEGWTNPLFASHLLRLDSTQFQKLLASVWNGEAERKNGSLLLLAPNDASKLTQPCEEVVSSSGIWTYKAPLDCQSFSSDVFLRQYVNKPMLPSFYFGAGIVSLVHDILTEFWTRLRNVSNCLLDPSVTDVLRAIRLLSQTMVISKPGVLVQTPELPKLFDQLELLLTSDAVPLDLRDTATRTWTLVQQAQRDWERIQQENLAKKKAIEDAEALRRHRATQEATKKEQQRKSAVSYVKAGLAKEARYNVSNPFWLLGIPPKLASIPLLAKAKRKLSLLLHPDKCLDSSLKPDAQIAFTAVIGAITMAEQLVTNGMHLSCIPPGERPPFADEVGIPHSDHHAMESGATHIPKASPTPSAPMSSNTTKHSSGAASSGNNRTSSVDAGSTSEKLEFWCSREFRKLVESNVDWITETVTHNVDAPPAPVFSTHLATKGQIWVTIPENPDWYIRLLISRPVLQPAAGDLTAEAHQAEDGITFLVPQSITEALRRATRLVKNSERCAEHLAVFSVIVAVRTSSFNLTEWTAVQKEVIQPILEEKRKKCSIYVAAQTVDSKRRLVSQTVWTSLTPRRFALPHTKPKIIKMIQIFDNAPASYRVLDVIRQHSDASKAPLTEFPFVKDMMGWTYSTLSTILAALIDAATYK